MNAEPESAKENYNEEIGLRSVLARFGYCSENREGLYFVNHRIFYNYLQVLCLAGNTGEKCKKVQIKTLFLIQMVKCATYIFF